ncbi:hypothetical protein A3A03_02900 [Candidatus Nomurabacteria bacterium RIFCSPLOWO2_01_FULL_40_18]|uniref:Methyltransferase FkbM domain-containing protein n=1 Tax=Candidatus Nomurabacteria bacterium RIFCSPLOWO2_01_FULL_40_18 TaxID=1801773 RepID=A0A1F6XJY7_9BACT|nr:MAG: hypothetical protein A3A03_02900 [Candidatus Nomurabacteria bacterium RIFCSPLOWO2_01_FULL_40_18]
MKKTIKKIVNYLGYDIIQLGRKQLTIRDIFISYFYKIPENFFFVQIGSHDGKTKDPLYDFVTQHNLEGILVEPQKGGVFEKLRYNYADCKKLTFANIALAETDSQQSLYCVKESFQDAYDKYTKYDATGIASFDRNHVRMHLKKNMPHFFKKHKVDNYIKVEIVEALSFDTFIRRFNIQRIDLLQIDVEGFDSKIIHMFNFNKFSPTLINYESKHLPKTERDKCEEFLQDKGYVLVKFRGGTCALKIR